MGQAVHVLAKRRNTVSGSFLATVTLSSRGGESRNAVLSGNLPPIALHAPVIAELKPVPLHTGDDTTPQHGPERSAALLADR